MAGMILNTRVDPDILEDAENILKTLGISRSVAINMFYRMVILKKLSWRQVLRMRGRLERGLYRFRRQTCFGDSKLYEHSNHVAKTIS